MDVAVEVRQIARSAGHGVAARQQQRTDERPGPSNQTRISAAKNHPSVTIPQFRTRQDAASTRAIAPPVAASMSANHIRSDRPAAEIALSKSAFVCRS
jgi:hypothetical protein